jgi:hypothetical protein
MTNTDAGGYASNALSPRNTDASKTISPAARKFAEYIARRMAPMIDHAARPNVPRPAGGAPEPNTLDAL